MPEQAPMGDKAHPSRVYIANADGSMYVHQLRGVVFVTWVSRQEVSRAQEFRASEASEWVKLIMRMTGVECQAVPVGEEPVEITTRSESSPYRSVESFDQMPSLVSANGEWFSLRRLEARFRGLLDVGIALRRYIDAIPKGTEFPTAMPGVDRTWVDRVLGKEKS